MGPDCTHTNELAAKRVLHSFKIVTKYAKLQKHTKSYKTITHLTDPISDFYPRSGPDQGVDGEKGKLKKTIEKSIDCMIEQNKN